jgi:hypothetical protein
VPGIDWNIHTARQAVGCHIPNEAGDCVTCVKLWGAPQPWKCWVFEEASAYIDLWDIAHAVQSPYRITIVYRRSGPAVN